MQECIALVLGKKSFHLLHAHYKYLQMKGMTSGIFFKTTWEVDGCSVEARVATSVILRASNGYREAHHMMIATLVFL